MRAKFIGAIILTTLLSFAVLAGIVAQQKQLSDMRLSSRENNIRKLLPIAQEQSKPISIATNMLLKKIRKILEKDGESLNNLHAGFKQDFGENSIILLMDSEHKILKCDGFNDEQTKDFKKFLQDFYTYHLSLKPHVTQETKDLVKNYFDETIAYDLLPNMINTTSCRLLGKEGLGIIATLVKPYSTKELSKEFAHLNPMDELKSSFLGSVFIFVPLENIENINFLSRNFSGASNESFAKSYFGSVKEIENHLKVFDPIVSRLFSEHSKNNLQGTFHHANTLFGFSRIELKKKEATGDDVFLLFSIEPAENNGWLITIFACALILFNLVVFTYLKNQTNKENATWSWNLSSKFVCLALISCLIPISGLLYQSYLKTQLEESSASRETFLKLEEKIATLEIKNRIKISDLMTQIRMFNETVESLETMDPKTVQEAAYKLRESKVIQVYIADESGEIQEFNTVDNWHSENTRAGTKIVLALMKFIKKNVQFKTDKPEETKGSVTEGLIVEEAADGMGSATLYQLAIKYYELIPFKMLYAAVWACVTMQRNEEGDPKRLTMFIVNRVPLMTGQIDETQSLQSQEFPELMFIRRTLQPIDEVGPNIVETKPDCLSMLQSLNKAGGVINLKAEIDGEKLYIAGRRLQGMDWTCLAISRAKKDKDGLFNQASLFTIALLAYLFVLILFLSRWIQKFFLNPVLSLTRSAAAITGGNYEIALDLHQDDDEIGYLSGSFAEMAADLKEKEFLNRFLSDIARDAIAGNHTTRATKVEATVLFSDIRSFTTLSEQYPPEEIALMLNSYMTLMETIIEKNSGSIEKFIGDAIMAIFLPKLGLPHPAVRAANTAKEMIRTLNEFNLERKRQNKFAITNGVGIAHGDLLMGTMGNLTGRRDYTVTGATVNIAAEMEKLSKLATGFPVVLCGNSAQHAMEAGIKCSKMNANGDTTGYELRESQY